MSPLPNPFPPNAVLTTSLTPETSFRTEYFEKAEEKVIEYILDFRRTDEPAFLVLGIRGKYGSGKTHLAFQIVEAIRSHAKQSGVACLSIYAKAEKADLLQIYSGQIAGRLREVDFKLLAASYYKQILTEKATASRPDEGTGTMQAAEQRSLSEIAREAVIKYGDGDPEYILELARKNLLPADDFFTRARKQLTNTDPALLEDFVRAYTSLFDSTIPPAALKWIRGQSISDDEAAALTLKITTLKQQHARDALKFLLTAYRRAGVIVIFTMDEFERFDETARLTSGTPLTQPLPHIGSDDAVRSVLKDLAETFKESGQVLIICGIEQAWASLPEDVFHRITWDNIIQAQMSRDDARGLLRLYCDAQRFSLRKVFDDPAMETLFEVSELNPRRLLQIAYHSYAGSDNKPISAADVRKSAVKALGDTQRMQTAKQRIQKVAAEFGLNPNTVDNADVLTLGELDSPPVVVYLMRSLFRVEEVKDAWDIASRVIDAARNNARLRACTVVIGYSSDAVRRELSKTVDRVIIFDEDRFAGDFRDFLEWALRTSDESKNRTVKPESYVALNDSAQREEGRLKVALVNAQQVRSDRIEEHRRLRTREKMLETLTDIFAQLRSEELLLLHREEELLRTEFSQALQYADTQRALLREIEYLNVGFSDTTEFFELIRTYRAALDSAESRWKGIYRYGSQSFGPLEITFSIRQRAIRDMESLQIKRSQSGQFRVLEFIYFFLRWPHWLRILALLSIVGIAVFIYSTIGAWEAQKRADEIFVNKISALRDKIVVTSDNINAGTIPDDIQSIRSQFFGYYVVWNRILDDYRFATRNLPPEIGVASESFERVRRETANSYRSTAYGALVEAEQSLRAIDALLSQRLLWPSILRNVLVSPQGLLLVPVVFFLQALIIRHWVIRRRRVKDVSTTTEKKDIAV